MDFTFGLKRHAMVTDADRLMVTDIEVILSATLLPVPKYNGTKASQITHVVYMVKPERETHYKLNSRINYSSFQSDLTA